MRFLDSRIVKAGALAGFYALVGLLFYLTEDNQQAFQVLTAIATTLSWVFLLLYGFRSPWRINTTGRSLMYVWMALTAILTLIFFSYYFGAYPGRDYVRAALYSTLIPAFGSFIKVLVSNQDRRIRRGKAALEEDSEVR